MYEEPWGAGTGVGVATWFAMLEIRICAIA